MNHHTSALDIVNLTKTYANGVLAINEINLTVKKGDFFGLLGPNGAGKSTTIGIICSLVNKTAGYVRIFGHDIYKHPFEAKSCQSAPTTLKIVIYSRRS